jgi:hypothetical protein
MTDDPDDLAPTAADRAIDLRPWLAAALGGSLGATSLRTLALAAGRRALAAEAEVARLSRQLVEAEGEDA